MTVESGAHFCFHYVVSSGVCILTLTERAYPKRLAFDYLDELRKEFFQIYGAQIAAATRPYEFIRFDTFIQKTKKVYNDSKTQRNLQKLNSELKDVHSIMTKNINEVISRGERLESTFSEDHKRLYDLNVKKCACDEARFANCCPCLRMRFYDLLRRCGSKVHAVSTGIEEVCCSSEACE